jgi:hypothetical protein
LKRVSKNPNSLNNKTRDMGQDDPEEIEPANWMDPPLDQAILKTVQDLGPISQEVTITHADMDQDEVMDRIQLLCEHGLLEKADRSIRITDHGENYLQHEGDDKEFEET